MSDSNKRKVQLFVEAVCNQGRLELIDDLVAANYRGRISGLREGVVGREGVRRLVSNRRRAYPDLYIKIESQIAEEDLVTTCWRAWSRLAGARSGLSAAGGRGCCQGVSIVRLLAGKQVESVNHYTVAESVSASEAL